DWAMLSTETVARLDQLCNDSNDVFPEGGVVYTFTDSAVPRRAVAVRGHAPLRELGAPPRAEGAARLLAAKRDLRLENELAVLDGFADARAIEPPAVRRHDRRAPRVRRDGVAVNACSAGRHGQPAPSGV